MIHLCTNSDHAKTCYQEFITLVEDITLLLVEDDFKGNTGRIVHVRSDKKTGEIPFSRQCTLEKALHNIKRLKKIKKLADKKNKSGPVHYTYTPLGVHDTR